MTDQVFGLIWKNYLNLARKVFCSNEASAFPAKSCSVILRSLSLSSTVTCFLWWIFTSQSLYISRTKFSWCIKLSLIEKALWYICTTSLYVCSFHTLDYPFSPLLRSNSLVHWSANPDVERIIGFSELLSGKIFYGALKSKLWESMWLLKLQVQIAL